MPASNEYIKWHLTPSGWVKGSYHLDFNEPVSIDPPKDRVLTCTYKEFMSSGFSKLETSVVEEWSSRDKEKIQELLSKFGECPERFY